MRDEPLTYRSAMWLYFGIMIGIIGLIALSHISSRELADVHKAETAQMKRIESIVVVQRAEIESYDPAGVCWQAEESE